MSHDLEPLAHTCRWTFRRPAEPATCAQALADLLAGIAADCQARSGHVIGHIKAYAPLPAGGFIRGNAVSARQAPDVELHEPAGSAVASIDVTLNVLVVGLERDDCRRRALSALDAVAARYGFDHSTPRLHSQGEDDG
jgi:hypothetical protein